MKADLSDLLKSASTPLMSLLAEWRINSLPQDSLEPHDSLISFPMNTMTYKLTDSLTD